MSNLVKKEIELISSSSGTEENPITVAYGWDDYEHIFMVMDLLYADLFTLSDGNSVIGTVKSKSDGEKLTYLYTPLLPVNELEQYCKRNCTAYCDLADNNKDELEANGVLTLPQGFLGSE